MKNQIYFELQTIKRTEPQRSMEGWLAIASHEYKTDGANELAY